MTEEVSFKKRKNRGIAHARGRPSSSSDTLASNHQTAETSQFGDTNANANAAAVTTTLATRTVTITDADDNDDNDTVKTKADANGLHNGTANGDDVARTTTSVEDEFEIPDDNDIDNMDQQEPAWRKAAAEATLASERVVRSLVEPNEDDEDDDETNTSSATATNTTKRARTSADSDNDNDTNDTAASTNDGNGTNGEANDGPSSEAARMKRFRESAKERLQKRQKKDANPLVQSTRDRLKKGIEVVSVASKRSAAPDKTTNDHQVAVEIEQSDKPKKKEGQAKWLGPIRVAANTRNISRFDYQPNLCKDYNETGYCSFGDACKFHHDRGDYKSGWQIEKEWKAEQELKKKRAMGEYVADEPDYRVDQEEEFPFACHICREEFTNPIVTKCKHYFCEKCALQRYARDTKCAVCNEQTHGLFSTAHKLIAHLKKKANGTAAKKVDDDPHAKHKSGRSSGEGWIIP